MNSQQTIDGGNQVLLLPADRERTEIEIMAGEEVTEDIMDTTEEMIEDTIMENVMEDTENLTTGPSPWPGMTDWSKNCSLAAPAASTLTSTRTFLSRPRGQMCPRVLSHSRMLS